MKLEEKDREIEEAIMKLKLPMKRPIVFNKETWKQKGNTLTVYEVNDPTDYYTISFYEGSREDDNPENVFFMSTADTYIILQKDKEMK